MNLRDLKYLVVLAETRHFGRAAERCFVGQSTLSGQIKKLEEELGVVLFERTKRSVVATPLGEAVVEQARRVLEQADALHHLAQSYQDPLAGPLRLGAIPTLSPYLMPLVLAPLREHYPQTRLVLSEELTDSLLTRLSRHEIDAALLATPVVAPDLESIALFDEPFWLIHHRNHPLSDKQEILASDLVANDLLLLAEGHCLAEQAMAICHMRDRIQQGEMADLRAASLETLMQMVVAGFGCTLLPALALGCIANRDPSIVTRRLQLPDAFRRVSLVYRRTFPRRQVLRVLVEVIAGHLPDTVQPCALKHTNHSPSLNT